MHTTQLGALLILLLTAPYVYCGYEQQRIGGMIRFKLLPKAPESLRSHQ